MLINSSQVYVEQMKSLKKQELNRDLTAQEIYDIAIQAQREAYERQDFYDLPERFIAKEEEFYNKVAKGKTFGKQKYQRLNVHPVYCTPEETEQKKIIQDRAFKACANGVALKVAASTACKDIYVFNEKYIDRKLQNLLVPFVTNMDDLKTKTDEYAKADAAGRSTYMKHQIDTIADFCVKLSSATTDAEIVSAFEGHEMIYFALGEVDGLFNKSIVAEMENTLGITLDEETWAKAKFIKDVAVDFGGLLNRVGNIASPYYSKYKDLSFLQDFKKWESGEVAENLLGDDDIAEEYRLLINGNDIYDKEKALRSPIYEYGAGNDLYAKASSRQRILNSCLSVMAYTSKMNNVTFKTQKNKNVSQKDAAAAMSKKQYVDVYNEGKFVKRIYEENKYGQFHTDLTKEMTLDPRKDEETLTSTLRDLKQACDAVNRKTTWYARLHNSLFPGKFTKTVNELNSLLKSHSNPAKLAKKFEAIAKKADNYLQAKLQDTASHTELTEKRIQEMLKVYNICKLGAQRAKDAQKDLVNQKNNVIDNKATHIEVKEAADEIVNTIKNPNVEIEKELEKNVSKEAREADAPNLNQ